jgi:hypothetical protein
VTSAGGRERQAALVPAIHVFSAGWEGTDGRDKRGHDDLRPFIIPVKHAPRLPGRIAPSSLAFRFLLTT